MRDADGDLLKVTDAEGIIAAIDQRYVDNPIDKLGEAANEVAKLLIMQGYTQGKLKH